MSVRVVDASLVKDKTPQSDRFLKNTYQATIAPGLPPLIFTTDYINDSVDVSQELCSKRQRNY